MLFNEKARRRRSHTECFSSTSDSPFLQSTAWFAAFIIGGEVTFAGYFGYFLIWDSLVNFLGAGMKNIEPVYEHPGSIHLRHEDPFRSSFGWSGSQDQNSSNDHLFVLTVVATFCSSSRSVYLSLEITA